MNEIVNNVLLRGDKIMPEMHLKQWKNSKVYANRKCRLYL